MDATEVREYLLELDPDAVVDYLGISTEDLVYELREYIADRARENEYESD